MKLLLTSLLVLVTMLPSALSTTALVLVILKLNRLITTSWWVISSYALCGIAILYLLSLINK